jgi:hypothetical protein
MGLLKNVTTSNSDGRSEKNPTVILWIIHGTFIKSGTHKLTGSRRFVK